MDQSTVTLIACGIGICGTLGGIVVGHILTRSWQRRQWLLDSRKAEFRELLTTLTKSFATISFLRSPGMIIGPDDQRALHAAITDAQVTIRDRIYIADEVAGLGIYELWKNAVDEFYVDRTFIAFAEKYALIRAKLVSAATDRI